MNTISKESNSYSNSKENSLLVRTKQGVYLLDYVNQTGPDDSNKITSWN